MPTLKQTPPVIQTTLWFPTKFKRFWGLRKFKKQHPSLKILSTGLSGRGWDKADYYAIVQYES